MPSSLARRQQVESARCARDVLHGSALLRGSAVCHFEERNRARWLLSDEKAHVPFTTRPNRGLHWQAVGAALQVLGDHPAYRLSPAVVNSSWACTDLRSAFPEFSAVGLRPLQHGLVIRLVFEIKADPMVPCNITQVGIARLPDDPTMPLSQGMLWTSAGDVTALGAELEVVSRGWQGSGVVQRLADWCSGAPTWLDGSPYVNRLMLEVNLQEGTFSISVGGWVDEPVVFRVPILLREEKDFPWYPIVSLTGEGQEARLLDFQVRTDL